MGCLDNPVLHSPLNTIDGTKLKSTLSHGAFPLFYPSSGDSNFPQVKEFSDLGS